MRGDLCNDAIFDNYNYRKKLGELGLLLHYPPYLTCLLEQEPSFWARVQHFGVIIPVFPPLFWTTTILQVLQH